MLSRRHMTAILAAAMPMGLAPARSRASEAPVGDASPGLRELADARPMAATLDLPTLVKGRLDWQDRLTIPVMVGAEGPFSFAVDTGADRSCLSNELVARLSLPAGPNVMVQGISGSALVPTARTPSLTIGLETLQGGMLPVLARSLLGVDGLLGVDALQNRRLVISFRDRLLELRQPGQNDEYVANAKSALVSARNRQGLLTVAGAKADNVPVEAFIDSGGAFSVGNLALAKALSRGSGGWDAFAPAMRIVDITGGEAVGQVQRVRTLEFGSMRFTDMDLVFCNLPIFNRWGLSDKPAVLVGANALKVFSRIEMDYGRKRIYFQMAADPMIWLADNAVMG